jgi:glycine cleavage system H protein
LFLPLSGEIIEFNESLEDEPEKVNSDPYGDGWMIKLKISDTSEVENLLSAEDYKAIVSG